MLHRGDRAHVECAHNLKLPLTNFVRHNHAQHERLLLVAAPVEELPRVSNEHRVEVTEIAPDVRRVVLRYGFMESPCIPDEFRLAIESASLTDIDLDDLSFYIGRETIIPTERVRGMAVWREALFAFVQRNVERSAAYFQIPARQVVEIGAEIEI